MTWTSGPCEPANDETTARDRAAVAIGSLANTTNEQAEKVLDWLQAHPEVLRALAGAPTADVAAPPHSDPCSTCGGYGIVHDPGYYVPGEQFVEPPSDERCEDCVGTGMREVQERIRAAAPEGVDAAEEPMPRLEALMAETPPWEEPDGMDLEAQGEMAAREIPADELAEAERYVRTMAAHWDNGEVPAAMLTRVLAEYDERGRERDAARAELAAAQAAIQRVREKHEHAPAPWGGEGECLHCRDAYGDHVTWPCPTVRALDGDITEEG